VNALGFARQLEERRARELALAFPASLTVHADWEERQLSPRAAGNILRARLGMSPALGDPAQNRALLDVNGICRAIVARYRNGQCVTLLREARVRP
jgi:hypothetical protein